MPQTFRRGNGAAAGTHHHGQLALVVIAFVGGGLDHLSVVTHQGLGLADKQIGPLRHRRGELCRVITIVVAHGKYTPAAEQGRQQLQSRQLRTRPGQRQLGRLETLDGQLARRAQIVHTVCRVNPGGLWPGCVLVADQPH